MTLIETFCQLYAASMKSPSDAARLAPRISEVWGNMSETDQEIASSLLKLQSNSGTNYEES